jgi:hypothetical protein
LALRCEVLLGMGCVGGRCELLCIVYYLSIVACGRGGGATVIPSLATAIQVVDTRITCWFKADPRLALARRRGEWLPGGDLRWSWLVVDSCAPASQVLLGRCHDNVTLVWVLSATSRGCAGVLCVKESNSPASRLASDGVQIGLGSLLWGPARVLPCLVVCLAQSLPPFAARVYKILNCFGVPKKFRVCWCFCENGGLVWYALVVCV